MKAQRFVVIAAAFGAAAVVLVYANSLHNTFHFDDDHTIVRNVSIRSLDNVPRFFTDARTFSAAPTNAAYRPLVTLTLAFDYWRGRGLDPLQFHVTQIILMLVVWAMVFAFTKRALDVARPAAENAWIALIAATIFAVHTVNTETMNLISARSEELAAIGILGSFLLFQFSSVARRSQLYLVPVVIGALAKAQIVAFAGLLIAYLLLIERKRIRIALPAVAVSVVVLAVLNRLNGPQWTPGNTPRWNYFITQGRAWMHYTRLFFIPAGLTADTDWMPFAHWYEPLALAGFAFVLALLAAIGFLARRDDTRPASFGLAWYAIALLPTSSIYPLAEVVNEHRPFLPYIGLSLAAVYLLSLVCARRRIVFAFVSIAAICALSAGTFVRNRVWATEVSLWRDTIAKSPGNVRALIAYGHAQMSEGKYELAKEYYARAASRGPDSALLEINRAIVEGALGNDAIADQHFRRALALQNDADSHYYYARWLIDAGRVREGESHLQIATQIDPQHGEAALLRQQLAALQNDDARDMRVDCRSYQQCFREGSLHIRAREFLDAALANRQATLIDARAADAWINLGWSLAQIGLDAQAERAFLRALQLRPADESAAGNLKWLRSGKPALR